MDDADNNNQITETFIYSESNTDFPGMPYANIKNLNPQTVSDLPLG